MIGGNLTPRQRRAYVHRADVWRSPDAKVTDVTQPRAGSSPDRVLRNVPCQYVFTQNIDQTTNIGRVTSPGEFTRDRIGFSAEVDVRNTDFIVNVTMDPRDPTKLGRLYGQVHKVQGDTKIVEGPRGRVNELTVEMMVEQKPPSWVAREYPESVT